MESTVEDRVHVFSSVLAVAATKASTLDLFWLLGYSGNLGPDVPAASFLFGKRFLGTTADLLAEAVRQCFSAKMTAKVTAVPLISALTRGRNCNETSGGFSWFLFCISNRQNYSKPQQSGQGAEIKSVSVSDCRASPAA